MKFRRLENSDATCLEAFLSRHAESSMFLRGNVKLAGIDYHGERYQGEFFAAFDSHGAVSGVLAHFWNGNIIMQCPDLDLLAGLVAYYRHHVSREVEGVLGVGSQVEVVIDALNLTDAGYSTNDVGWLYGLKLTDLIIPSRSESGDVSIVPASAVERDLLLQWMRDFEIESLGAEDGESFRLRTAERVDRMTSDSDCWALRVDNSYVSLVGFNSRLPDIVQVGPVWTPPEYRCNGYARYLLAHVLDKAKAEGVDASVLFTATLSARRAYEAIGYHVIDTFHLALLKESTIVTA